MRLACTVRRALAATVARQLRARTSAAGCSCGAAANANERAQRCIPHVGAGREPGGTRATQCAVAMATRAFQYNTAHGTAAAAAAICNHTMQYAGVPTARLQRRQGERDHRQRATATGTGTGTARVQRRRPTASKRQGGRRPWRAAPLRQLQRKARLVTATADWQRRRLRCRAATRQSASRRRTTAAWRRQATGAMPTPRSQLPMASVGGRHCRRHRRRVAAGAVKDPCRLRQP